MPRINFISTYSAKNAFLIHVFRDPHFRNIRRKFQIEMLGIQFHISTESKKFLVHVILANADEIFIKMLKLDMVENYPLETICINNS